MFAWGVVLWVWFSDVEDVDVMGCDVCTRGGDLKPSLHIVGCNAEAGEHKCLYRILQQREKKRKGPGRRGSKRLVSEGYMGEKGQEGHEGMRCIRSLCVMGWDGVGGTVAGGNRDYKLCTY